MSYSPTILARAEARLKQAQEAHRRQQAQQQAAIHQALPRTAEIDRRLRQTAPRILAASLRQGANQEGALAALRRENLALQEEERALLTQAGYPADALEDTPLCPLCGDRGWKGAAMCSCLGDLCRQEQIAELSSLLDLGDQSFQNLPPGLLQRPGGPPVRPLPPGGHGPHPPGLPAVWGGVPPVPPPEPLPLRGPGAGEDLPVGLHRPDGGGERVLRGLRHRRQRLCPVEEKKFLRYGEEARQAGEDTRRYLACDLLILDDLGSEFTSPFVQAALYQVVNTRLIDGKHTVISSNLDPEGIRQRYSAQVASRLQGEYLCLGFLGEDIRRLRRGR